MAPTVPTTIGDAARGYLGDLQNWAATRPDPVARLRGPRVDARVRELATFLTRNQVAFERVVSETDDETEPVLELRDGTRLVAPTMREAAAAVGLAVEPAHDSYDVVILGAGSGRAHRSRQRGRRGAAHAGRRVPGAGRTGGHVEPHRELHGVPVRCLRGRPREPRPAAGEAARRRDRRDPLGHLAHAGRAPRHPRRQRVPARPGRHDRDRCRLAGPGRAAGRSAI